MKYTFEQKLLQEGYRQVENKFRGESVFVNYDYEIPHIIITTERFNVQMESALAARQVKERTIHERYELTSAVILLVVFGDKRDLRNYGKNTVCVCTANGSLKHVHIEKTFQVEYGWLKEISRNTKKRYAQMEADTEGRKTRWFRYSFVYLILTAFNAAIYFKMFGKNVYAFGISADTVIQNREWGRMVTYMLLHSSLIHVLSNSISLLIIGKQFEQRNGGICLLYAYILGGFLAGCVSVNYAWYLKPEYADTITVGASGAIFALVGALLMDVLLDADMTGRRAAVIRYCVLVLILSNIGTNIDRACHIGGFAAGMFLYFIWDKVRGIIADCKYIRNSSVEKAAYHA